MRDIKNAILRVGVGVGGIRVRSGTRLEEFGARKSCSAPAFVLELVLLHPTVRENFGDCHETSVNLIRRNRHRSISLLSVKAHHLNQGRQLAYSGLGLTYGSIQRNGVRRVNECSRDNPQLVLRLLNAPLSCQWLEATARHWDVGSVIGDYGTCKFINAVCQRVRLESVIRRELNSSGGLLNKVQGVLYWLYEEQVALLMVSSEKRVTRLRPVRRGGSSIHRPATQDHLQTAKLDLDPLLPPQC